MSPQISIIGLAIVAALYAATAVLLTKLGRFLGPSRWRWALIVPLAAIAIAAPWVDELWISWHFNELCRDAGVHITRKVEVEGYYDDTSETHRGPPSAQGISDFDKRGYRFYEMRSRDKYVFREKTDSEWRTEIRDQVTAKYHYKKTRDDVNVGYKLAAIEYVVLDSNSGAILGRQALYKRYPGWVDTLWLRYLGSGMTMCPDPERASPQPIFPDVVLIPAKRR